MALDSAGTYCGGIFRKGDVRLSDLSGRKRLPIGNSSFLTTVENAVFVDKSMLIADVIDGSFTAMLYCRPRRFGKSLNLSMLQRFFEIPSPNDPAASDTTRLFEGLAIWDADGGAYRSHHAAYPVVHLSFNNTKSADRDTAYSLLAAKIAAEYRRHHYLLEEADLTDQEQSCFERILGGTASPAELRNSLADLTGFLFRCHEKRAVVLIDEYDAPVMSAYTAGYYDVMVEFLKGWLTGALKDNEALAFACLTGVQRISKESIFSDLNNLGVNTALSVASDERFGFTYEEVAALTEYLGFGEPALEEARRWYDGYRFGEVDVYNPWSVLNFFNADGAADVYWGNTSGNAVLGDVVEGSDSHGLAQLYRLLEPGGTVEANLDLGVVFPDIGIRSDVLWSMLYLAGYLTTNDTECPNDTELVRRLRIPNEEIGRLYRAEIVERFAHVVGGRERLFRLHRAFVDGDAEEVAALLEEALIQSASSLDLTRENSYHMLLLGLLFGISGYGAPLSNRESGFGRYDIRLSPLRAGVLPVITLEFKYLKSADADQLEAAADEALGQIERKAYETDISLGAPVLRYGIAFSGKSVAVKCEVGAMDAPR